MADREVFTISARGQSWTVFWDDEDEDFSATSDGKLPDESEGSIHVASGTDIGLFILGCVLDDGEFKLEADHMRRLEAGWDPVVSMAHTLAEHHERWSQKQNAVCGVRSPKGLLSCALSPDHKEKHAALFSPSPSWPDWFRW